MKLHEALRQLFAKYGGRVMDEDAHFDIMGWLSDIYMEGTTKALAIEQVKAATGAERVVVFGDNLNDIPMMRAADWSVAVENAYSEVKLAASEVIGLNTDDAVVKWIKEDRFRLKSPQIHSSKIQSPSKL